MRTIAWITGFSSLLGLAALALGFGARAPQSPPAPPASMPGAGSAAAFPFGRPASDLADGAEAWTRALSVPPGLPRTVATLGDESLAHALDRLASLARRGDAQAAYDAYELAQFCAASADFERALVMLPVETDRALLNHLQGRATQSEHLCEGATPAQLGEGLSDIRIAADGGIKGAAERLLDTQLTAPIASANSPAASVDSATMSEAQHAIELVHRDALGGDVEALVALASLYQTGGLVAHDQAQAVLFQSAALEIMKSQPQVYSVGEIDLEQEYTTSAQGLLAPDEGESLHNAAVLLVAHCCQTSGR